ncbi:MAG TPA: biotin/lipoate--protein ligase family protein [Arenibaculum sp.]|nr:biotin/lipoate--protein ligase family protein [Arenibaculum sp.]
MTQPSLPPIFHALPVPGEDPFVRLLRHAGEHGAGTFAWRDEAGCLECVVVLEPEETTPTALTVAFAAMLGLGDALGALGPARMPVLFTWPGGIELNGARVGRLRVAVGPETDGVPAWLLAGIELRMHGGPDDAEPGRHPESTTLFEEGFGAVTSTDLLESYARHLLHWISRWQDEGFAVVRKHWLDRWAERGTRVVGNPGGRTYDGIAADVDAYGALVLSDGSAVPLRTALSTGE